MQEESAGLQQFAGVGTVLAGKYQLDRIVGTGGMGVVVGARHLSLNTQVAIKFLLPRDIHREKLIARFQREARAASRIASPRVVRVLDIDLRDDGVPYIVMEFLEGETLQSLLERSVPLGLAESVDYMLEVAEALAAAHAAGIVHRDLKPANLFLTQGTEHERTIKILDFGIAKLFESDETDPISGITASGAFIGSPPYMSPEQLAHPANVDARTDIWSLGIVLYECLTGATPFAASGVGPTCARILDAQPAPLRSLRPELPEVLDRILSRCLAKQKEARFASVHELARALAPLGTERADRSLRVIERTQERSSTPGRELGSSKPPIGTSTHTLPDAETALAESTTVRPPKAPNLRTRRFAVIGVLVVAVAASLLARALQESASTAVPTPSHAATSFAAAALLTASTIPEPEPRPPEPPLASPSVSAARTATPAKRSRPVATPANADDESVYLERE
jgi:serine/threonine protein kinase